MFLRITSDNGRKGSDIQWVLIIIIMARVGKWRFGRRMCYHPQKSSKRVGDRALAAGLRRPSGAAAGPKRNGAPRWRVRKWWLAAASGAVPAPRLGPRRLQARRRRRGRSPPAPPALAHLGGLPAHPHALADEPPRRRKNFGYWTQGVGTA